MAPPKSPRDPSQESPPEPEHSGQPPIRALTGLGPKQQENLSRLEIRSLEDLLRHYPQRWVDRRTLRPLGSFRPDDLRATEVGEDGRERRPQFTVLGVVVGSRVAGRPRGRHARGGPPQRLQVVIRDDTGSATVVFFGGGWRQSHFEPGAKVLVSGPLTEFRGAWQFQSPEYEILNDAEEFEIHTGRLFPVYPLTKGITQRQMRLWMHEALGRLDGVLTETLPASLRDRYRLVDLRAALQGIHFPADPEARRQARRRLAFEELFVDQLFVAALRRRRELGNPGRSLVTDGPLLRRVRAGLPFDLTGDQERALEEILADLRGTRPANRLLQGDVGSGKTVVALLAAAAAADSGMQTAIMAPTEILAEQHFRTLGAMAGSFGLEPRLLTGSLSGAARREVLRAFADGSCPLAVGTHALFQAEVRFFDLGLVIMDEQHRFGVMQRMALWEKGRAPHVLVMSATPIPRSLALVRYADLDLSVIRERPAGRGKVITRVTTGDKRDSVYGFMAERLREGRQAFIIYPLVEESDKSELKAATTMARQLAERPEFHGYEVALLHGQMKSEEKDAVMKRFVAGEAQVLVATTVVEVGIDVPNASFMIIEHPERYGLSQLHQLRGRIGRGKHLSYCVLVHDGAGDERASERLEEFARTDDGFRLAEIDLTLRGQGDVAGIRQSGRPGYRLADPWRDEGMLTEARDRAQEVLAHGALAEGGDPEWGPMRGRLQELFEALGPLIDVG